jgi:hypothetical protein
LRPLSLFLALLAAAPVSALRPGIPRVTGFSDHFSYTIDANKSELLSQLAALAESCWTRQSRFFDFKPPGRIQMVFLDEQDYANGFAYAPQEWVVIYLHAGEFALRGKTRWLPNVMAHEIGHVFTLRKMGEDSRFLGWKVFHGWNGRGPSRFDAELRWDYGRVPPWLAEGLAQYASEACGFDTLDTHRRMALRVAAASGQLLTPAELKGFAWDGRRNELIYAQGFALVTWLYHAYGPQAMNRYLEAAHASGWRSAFRKAFGKSLADLYEAWRKDLEAQSRYEAAGDGSYVLPEPPGPYAVESFPTPLGDGRYLYLSSRDNDYGSTDLYLGDGDGHAKRLFENATSIRWDGAGHKAYFTAGRYAFLQGDAISDLYSFDAETGDIAKLTSGGRIARGCAAGGSVYGLRDHEGRTSIVKIADGAWTTVFTAPDSFEITDLAPGRTAGGLVLGTTSGFGNDLRELDPATSELAPLAVSPQEEIDPHWSGDTLYFSADYAGSFDVYALVGEDLTRLTHADGGAFHPFPSYDGLWLSAYGPAGFRLARARASAQTAPFTVELPTAGWKRPALLEFEADSYDHSRLSLLGFDVSLGAERRAGSLDTSTDSAGTLHRLAVDAGTRALAEVGVYWKNPTGVMDARLDLGLSRPLDYEGATHLDRSRLDLRVRAFLPDIVAGGSYAAFDFPSLEVDGRKHIQWVSELDGYLGMDLRLAEHWTLSGRGLAGEIFSHDDVFGDRDSDAKAGGAGSLDYANLRGGKDGIVKGFAAFLQGGKPPRLDRRVPDWSADAGLSVYASAARLLFLQGNLYNTVELAGGTRSWAYGDARAYVAVPLGLQAGTRGGAGLYLDRLLPTVEYRGMSRFTVEKAPGAPAFRPAWEAPGAPDRSAGLTPRIGGFWTMIDRETSHEAGFGLTLTTLALSGHAAAWSAMVRFDALDFSREPSWAVGISL